MAESSNSSSWLASGTTKAVLAIVGAGALAIVISNRTTSSSSSSSTPTKKERPPTVLASPTSAAVSPFYTVKCADGIGPLLGDASHLYLGACGGKIHRIAKTSGIGEVFAEVATNGASQQFAMDETHLYFPDGRSIRTMPKAKTTATTIDPAPCKSDLAVDEDSIYCIARGTVDGILRVPKVTKAGGGNVAATSILKTAPSNTISALAIDDASIYFAIKTTQPLTLQIVRMPKAGGSEVVLAKRDGEHKEVPIENARSLTIMGDNAYWVNWCNGCPIASAKKAGGGEAMSHTSVENQTFEAFVAYDGELYATSGDAQLVGFGASTTKHQFPTAPTDTTLQNKAPRALHVDATHVYWARPHEQHFVIERIKR
jgi:hypothetical protein